MCSMSAHGEENGVTPPAEQEGSVLANLPRERPQRSSPRRAAARTAERVDGAPAASDADLAAPPKTASSPDSGATPARSGRATNGASKRQSSERRARATSDRRGPRATRAEPAPTQGYECEGERVTGPVQPPGGSDFAASAIELVGELVKGGLSSGERLLRDALSRLPLP
jgi:hypothetical protein